MRIGHHRAPSATGRVTAQGGPCQRTPKGARRCVETKPGTGALGALNGGTWRGCEETKGGRGGKNTGTSRAGRWSCHSLFALPGARARAREKKREDKLNSDTGGPDFFSCVARQSRHEHTTSAPQRLMFYFRPCCFFSPHLSGSVVCPFCFLLLFIFVSSHHPRSALWCVTPFRPACLSSVVRRRVVLSNGAICIRSSRSRRPPPTNPPDGASRIHLSALPCPALAVSCL